MPSSGQAGNPTGRERNLRDQTSIMHIEAVERNVIKHLILMLPGIDIDHDPASRIVVIDLSRSVKTIGVWEELSRVLFLQESIDHSDVS